MERELARLSHEHPRPTGWSSPQLFADEVRLGPTVVRRVGIACHDASGSEATGSAAQTDGSPVSRAWFELLERQSLLGAGRDCVVRDARGNDLGERAIGCPAPGDDPRRRPARSNGVALHQTWEAACEAARFELLERDDVLRAWCGELDLEPVGVPEALRAIDTHDWRCVRVARPGRAGDPADAHQTAVVVGFPRGPQHPLARGFAARRTVAEAVDGAGAEALQNLAFLCDEPVPTERPPLEPSPMFHLDLYLWPAMHDTLRRWLDGGHRGFGAKGAARPGPRDFRYADLTPSGSRLRVARALAPGAVPLMFGELPDELAAALPAALRVHPIS